MTYGFPPTNQKWQFVGRCDSLECQDLQDFDDSMQDITAGTMRKHLGSEMWKWIEGSLGYYDENGKPDSSLRLANDWAVGFEKGKWKGKPALCIRWSAYHHIFVFS
jgi:hypothetical protein